LSPVNHESMTPGSGLIGKKKPRFESALILALLARTRFQNA
jgi:hypothetical protein